MKPDSNRRVWLRAAAGPSLAPLVLGASIATAASLATAASHWYPPVPLAPPVALLNLQVDTSVALDPVQNAVAVWDANGIIEAADQVRGGSWSVAVDISQPTDYESTLEPQVVLPPVGAHLKVMGTAVAIWTSFTAVPEQTPVYAIKFASKNPGSAWTGPAAIVTSTTGWLDSPRLGMDRLGNTVAVWRRMVGGFGRIDAATLPRGGAWSLPVTLSDGGRDASVPTLALNPLGYAVVAWQAGDSPGSPLLIQAVAKDPGGGWSAPADVSSPTLPTGNARVAIDAVGNAVAVWNQATVVMSAVRGAAGRWGVPQVLSAPGSPGYGMPAVAMDLDGNTIAAWTETAGAAIMHVATRARGAAWSPPLHVSTGDEDCADPRVAFSPSKPMMVVTWVDNSSNTARASVALGGRWTAPVTLGDAIWSSTVEVAATQGMLARALWARPTPYPLEAWAPVVSAYGP